MKTRYLVVLASVLLAVPAWGRDGSPLSRDRTEAALRERVGPVGFVVAQAGQTSGQQPSPAESPATDSAEAREGTGTVDAPAEAAPADQAGTVAEEPVEAESGKQPGEPAPVPPVPPAPPSSASPPTPPFPPASLYPPGPRYAPRFTAPAAPPVPSPAAPLAAAPGGGFLIKFNNADLYEVIHTLGRMAQINYLIDPRVRGVVNVHTQGTIRKEGALDLLFSILKINGATAVQEGEIYHIVPMTEANVEPLLLAALGEKEGKGPPNRPVLRAFPLQYIAASEMAKVLKPFLTPGGDVTEVPRANMVLVTDTAANMEKHERLINLFDADAFRTAGVRLFPLKFLDPEEMGKNLESIFGALDFGAKGGKPAGINFVPLPRMNALLVVSASPRTMEEVERWIGELDREPTGTARTVHLYRVKHGKAKDVMAILEKLYPGKSAATTGKPTEFKPRVAEPAGGKPPSPAPRAESPSAAALQTENFDIILDEPRNALIIRGSASEYAAIVDTLRTVDIYPLQVLLEVLIAEVKLSDEIRLGVDWKYMSQSGDWKQSASLASSASGISQGLAYAFEKTDRLLGSIRALADDGKVSILSSPSVISTNGKESKIEVAEQVPVTSGQVTNVSGGGDVITTTVEYRDAGIILGFTPFINDEGLITLEISQNVSEVSLATEGALNNPVFLKRSIQTTLLASQDRSIVLGGLVQERRTRSRDGIPFLYKIPVIGWLFGARSDSVARTELLIFITPRVIESVEEGTQLSQEFEDRVKQLKQRIAESEGLRPTLREPQRPENW